MKFNPTTPYPEGLDVKVMPIDQFAPRAAAGVFTSYDVEVFWGNDKYYDEKASAWMTPQPVEATKVVIILLPEGRA